MSDSILLHTMMNHLPEAIYFKDREGRFLSVSRRLADLLGLADPAEAVGRTDRDFFSPDYAAQAAQDEQEVLSTGTAVIDKIENPKWPNGEASWIQTTKAPLQDASGNIIGTFGISHDVTPQKEIEWELRKSEERYRTLVEHSPDAIVVLDVDAGRFVDANQKAESLFGITRDELLRRHPAELSPPAQPDGRPSEEAAREHIERALQGRTETFDWIHCSAQGTDLVCEVRLAPFPSPTDHRLLRASITDVTWRKEIESDLRREIDERHRAEQELRRNVERTRRILESAQDAFIAMNDQGRIVDWNPQAESVFGWPRPEVLGRSVAETVIPAELRDDHEQGLQRFLATGIGPVLDRRIEVTACRRDGREIPVELTITAIPDEETWFFAAFLHDITNRKSAQAALQAAKEQAEAASLAKSEFLANMSHEIRTPMNAVIGLTELLLDTEVTETQRDYLETVLESSESLLTIINEVLDYSKVEAGRLVLEEAPYSIRDQLGDAMKLLGPRADANGLKLVWQVNDAVPDGLIGDPTRMRQLLMNLVGNAIKFTEQGEIAVRVWPDDVQSDSIDLHVCVRDTGIGIAAEQQEAIFEAFTQADSTTTRRYGGTGLGLTIAARIVEGMQGRIWVESQTGGGSKFHFVVPCAVAEDAPRRQRRDAASVPRLRPLKILLAEDGRANQKLAMALLNAWGHDVFIADDGIAAVEAWQGGGQGGGFDLVLMDVQMPRMDGLEATREIRRLERGSRRHTPIVAMTARAMPGDREMCLTAGMDGYLSKPVRQRELYDAIAPYFPEALTASVEEAESLQDGAANPPSAIVDWDIALKSVAGSRRLLADVINESLAELPDLMDSLERAVHGSDTTTAERMAHSIKGCAVTYGAIRLVQSAERLESSMQADELHDAERGLVELRAIIEELCRSLREFVE